MRTLEEIKAYHDKWSEAQIIGIMGEQYLNDMNTLFSISNGTAQISKAYEIQERYFYQARCPVQTIHSIDFLSNMRYLLEIIE